MILSLSYVPKTNLLLHEVLSPYEALGMAAWLAARNPARGWESLDTFYNDFIWPVLERQIIFFSSDSDLIGCATWAKLSDSDQAKYIHDLSKPDGPWNTGSNFWIVDMILVDDRYWRRAIRSLKEVLPKQKINFLKTNIFTGETKHSWGVSIGKNS